MSLDKLAVLFIIIILPISVVLNVYTDAQIKTLNLQLSYDTKLNSATADAVKAYQLNAFNESTSDLSASKMRDIDAAASTFFNSLGTSLNMDSYNIETLQSYVPALVFTMYDGYYIYSKYSNTLTNVENNSSGSKYQDGQLLYGTHPFVSYSCRYKRTLNSNNDDFVISYTLDNYITIQGQIGGEWINDSGYLIDTEGSSTKTVIGTNKITYRGVDIVPETIDTERVGGVDNNGNKLEYKYHKINGVKYYYDEKHSDSRGTSEPKWFSLINGDKDYINSKYNLYTDFSAYNYYNDAYNFTKRVKDKYKLENLTARNVVDADLEQAGKNENIFGSTFSERIEEPDSNFNEHRLAVIKYTIEKNLSIAIKNYNRFENGVEADFQMPKLEETEWDKILNNMTLISFLQGMPIGGKIYNGCCVIPNNKNDEVITENSIYIGNTSNKYYYKPTYAEFQEADNLIGILNTDLERRSIESGDASILPDNYYPKEYFADYDSVVIPTKNVNLYAEETEESLRQYAYNGNIYKYMKEKAEANVAKANVAKAYFTALGRERNSTYRINEPYKLPQDAKYYQNNSHRYYMYTMDTGKEKTWDEAEAFCESVGGHLVTINSASEKTFLQNNVINNNSLFWIGWIRGNGWLTKEDTGYSFSGIEYGIDNDNSNRTASSFICEWE